MNLKFPQFRGRKGNQRQAEELVDFLQEQGTQRTRIISKRKANAYIFMWPKNRKKHVAKNVDLFSSSDVESLESDGVEGCRVGRPLPSSSKCVFFDLCESESDAEYSLLHWRFLLVHKHCHDRFVIDLKRTVDACRSADVMIRGQVQRGVSLVTRCPKESASASLSRYVSLVLSMLICTLQSRCNNVQCWLGSWSRNPRGAPLSS